MGKRHYTSKRRYGVSEGGINENTNSDFRCIIIIYTISSIGDLLIINVRGGKMNKIILDLCGGTGAWSKPYKDAGYDVRLVTLPENDVRVYQPPENVYGILAAPPCTEFSIVKNHNLTRNIDAGMEIVNACLKIIEQCAYKFWALENPAGLLTHYLGKRNYSFQPYEFGDGWTKRTLLWGWFNMPEKQYTWESCPKIEGLYVRPGRRTPSIAFNHKSHKEFIHSFDCFEADTDAAFRSITPQGFARAFFDANK